MNERKAVSYGRVGDGRQLARDSGGQAMSGMNGSLRQRAAAREFGPRQQALEYIRRACAMADESLDSFAAGKDEHGQNLLASAQLHIVEAIRTLRGLAKKEEPR